jgi:hypothetical protein
MNYTVADKDQDLVINDPMFTKKCFETTVKQDRTVFIDLDFSQQNGYPPDHYMILFKIKSLLTGKTEVLNLFENNLFGSFNEIPLAPDASHYIMKEDFKFTIKLTATHDIDLSILTQYYEGPYFNDYYDNNTILDCSSFITLRPNNQTTDDLLSNK